MEKKNNLRILFMGTPEFAVHILDRMVTGGYQVVGVVTSPDKPAGRGQKMHASAVKKYAVKKGLTIFQPTNLKSDEFQEDLQKINPDVAVVVAFRMLPKKVWDFPPKGTFNLHASLLPDYRGAAPINWAIINGETETGVTTFFLDEKIDTGKIIARQKVAIEETDNVGTLHDKLMIEGGDLVLHSLDLIYENRVEPEAQVSTSDLKPAPKLNNENTQIDWNQKGQDIVNLIRGLNPYPVAWTTIQNGEEDYRCKIFEAEFVSDMLDLPIGKITADKSHLKISVQNGYLSILEMQLPGKRKMGIKDILNGWQIHENAHAL